MRRFWTGLAMAISLAAITAGGVVISQDGGAPEGTAHLWIDTDGGTCVDNASPVSYSSATACTPDAANDAADNGDTIGWKSGSSYSGNFTGFNSRSAMATITVPEGEDVTISGDLSFDDVRWLTIDGGGEWGGVGARLATDSSCSAVAPQNQCGISLVDTKNFVLTGVDFGGWYLNPGNTDFTISNSDIGPCDNAENASSQSVSGCGNGQLTNCESSPAECPDEGSGNNDGLVRDSTIEGNYIHDFNCDDSFYDGQGGNDCHWECLFVSWPNGMQIKRNLFENCANGGNVFITVSNGGGSFTPIRGFQDVLIENNVFTRSCTNSSPPCGGRRDDPIGFGVCGIVPPASGDAILDFDVRFNTFVNGAGFRFSGNDCSNDDRVDFVGNIEHFSGSGDGTCGNFWTPDTTPNFDYNIFYANTFTCGSNATNVGSSPPIVSNTDEDPDWHLTGAAGAADELVPSALCPATDLEGDARVGDCDAGADER